MDRTTLWRWQRQAPFQDALAAAERDALRALSRRLAAMGDTAALVLLEVMRDDDAGAGQRLRAANITLGRLLQAAAVVQLDQRLTALEAALAGDEEDP